MNLSPAILPRAPFPDRDMGRRTTDPKPAPRRLPWNFTEWFILSQTFLPALLYFPGTQPFRVPIRVASYGISLGALLYCWVLLPRRARRIRLSRAAYCLAAALLYLIVMLAHPLTNSVASGIGQVGMYLAVMAPVFWAPILVKSPERLWRLLWLLLLCSGANSFVGVMQVRNPDFWMPKEFSSVMMDSEFGLGNVIYEGSNGQMIIRPPGLLDAPGAVAGPATYALFLGLVFAVDYRRWPIKISSFIFAMLGAAAIFFTLVRSCFLIALGMLAVYLILQIGQKRFSTAIQLALVGGAAITLAFLHSVAVGGESLLERFKTITSENPADFYYENRGGQVASGFTELLPQYPLGAGLGRWGMMNVYFGNPQNTAAPPIWVEIQVPAWIVDGGLAMLVLYPAALLIVLWGQGTMAWCHPDKRFRTLAGVVFASNLGLVALCSSYAVFLSPLGTQFWFFSGALYGIGQSRRGASSGLLPSRQVSRPERLPTRRGLIAPPLRPSDAGAPANPSLFPPENR